MQCACVTLNTGVGDAERVLVRAFAGDEPCPLGPVLGGCGPLGVAEWQAEELESPLHRPAVAHFLPELRPQLADPRREEAPREAALVHARHVVFQIPKIDATIDVPR